MHDTTGNVHDTTGNSCSQFSSRHALAYHCRTQFEFLQKAMAKGTGRSKDSSFQSYFILASPGVAFGLRFGLDVEGIWELPKIGDPNIVP